MDNEHADALIKAIDGLTAAVEGMPDDFAVVLYDVTDCLRGRGL
ncbi:hypothetical protein [Oscillibacter sp.]|nr:hypothetical protein [Oscillibacter sp.]